MRIVEDGKRHKSLRCKTHLSGFEPETFGSVGIHFRIALAFTNLDTTTLYWRFHFTSIHFVPGRFLSKNLSILVRTELVSVKFSVRLAKLSWRLRGPDKLLPNQILPIKYRRHIHRSTRALEVGNSPTIKTNYSLIWPSRVKSRI